MQSLKRLLEWKLRDGQGPVQKPIGVQRLLESKRTVPHLYARKDARLAVVTSLRAALKEQGRKVCCLCSVTFVCWCEMTPRKAYPASSTARRCAVNADLLPSMMLTHEWRLVAAFWKQASSQHTSCASS